MALPHLDAAYNLARWLVRDDHDAQDIVQEAYLRALRFFAGFHGSDARGWLMAIVRNRCYSWLRRNRAAEVEFSEEDSAGATSATMAHVDEDPAAQLARHDDSSALARALDRLPVEFREVVVLRELEELSYKQIAAIVEVPIGTVMSRLARGRKLLAEALRPTSARTKQ